MENVTFLLTSQLLFLYSWSHSIPFCLCEDFTSADILYLASLHLNFLLAHHHQQLNMLQAAFIQKRGLLTTQRNCIFLPLFSSFSVKLPIAYVFTFFISLIHFWQASFSTILIADFQPGKSNGHFYVLFFLSLSAKVEYFHPLEIVLLFSKTGHSYLFFSVLLCSLLVLFALSLNIRGFRDSTLDLFCLFQYLLPKRSHPVS